jgi:hypothetical protein
MAMYTSYTSLMGLSSGFTLAPAIQNRIQDREKGFDGTLADWFAAYPDRDDRLEIGERRTKLSSILEVNGNRVRVVVVVLTDFLDVVLDEN